VTVLVKKWGLVSFCLDTSTSSAQAQKEPKVQDFLKIALKGTDPPTTDEKNSPPKRFKQLFTFTPTLRLTFKDNFQKVAISLVQA
jgi:hypothetical protein